MILYVTFRNLNSYRIHTNNKCLKYDRCIGEGPFSCPGARCARSLPVAVYFYTNINYFVIFCDFLRILFSRYIYSLLEGLIIITDCCMFER